MPQIQHVADVEGHSERVWSLAWHPTAPVMASCSSDKSVRLVPFGLANSISSSEEAAQAGPHISFKPDTSTALPLSHTRTVRAISWSPNGAMLATASFDSTVGIWERLPEEGVDDDPPETRQQHAQGAMTEHWENVSGLEGHENEVKAVAWSGTGSLLATCGRDKSVWIWECTDPAGDAEFDCVAVLMDHTQDVKQVVWHPHEELLASASYDDTIRIYQPDPASDDWASTHILPPPQSNISYSGPGADSEGGGVPFSQTGHTSTVWALAFSSDGHYLASCSEDTTIRIWRRTFLEPSQLPDINEVFRIGPAEKERWHCVACLQGHFERAVYTIDWAAPTSEDSLGYIAAAGSEGKLVVFDVKKPANDKEPLLHVDVVAEVDAHGVSDINCVRWCTSKPYLAPPPPSSDQEDEDTVMADDESVKREKQERWDRATRGVLGTAGDDGLVKIWRIQ